MWVNKSVSIYTGDIWVSLCECFECRGGSSRRVVASHRSLSMPISTHMEMLSPVGRQATPLSPSPLRPWLMRICIYRLPVREVSWSRIGAQVALAIILPVRINRIVYNNLPHFIIAFASSTATSFRISWVGLGLSMWRSSSSGMARVVIAIGLSSLLCVQSGCVWCFLGCRLRDRAISVSFFYLLYISLLLTLFPCIYVSSSPSFSHSF